MKPFGELPSGFLIGTNFVFMITFMIINSLACTEGWTDVTCIQKADNRMFLIQVAIYAALSVNYLVRFKNRNWFKLLMVLMATTGIYFVALTLHSISKATLL